MEATQLLRVMRKQAAQQQLQQQQLQIMEAILQLQMQQQTQQPQGAPQTAGIERQSQQQQLNMRGFDHIETLSGGEDQWQNWWKIKTAVSGMNGDLTEMLNAAETGGARNAEEIIKDDKFVDVNREQCIKASTALYSVLARYTNSEASPIVRSVTGLDGVEAWPRPHVDYSRGTLGKIFRVQHECMYPA